MIAVALIEEGCRTVMVLEDVGVARLRGVPFVLCAATEQWLVGESREVNTVLAHSYANLLWIVVVGTAVEEVELAFVFYD